MTEQLPGSVMDGDGDLPRSENKVDAKLLSLIMGSEMSGPYSNRVVLEFYTRLLTEGYDELVNPFLKVLEAVVVDARRELNHQVYKAKTTIEEND